MCLDRSIEGSLVYVVEKKNIFQNINRDTRCNLLFELESVKNKYFFAISIKPSDICMRVRVRAFRVECTAIAPRQDNEPIQCNIIRYVISWYPIIMLANSY
jgi:hypothetical protein